MTKRTCTPQEAVAAYEEQGGVSQAARALGVSRHQLGRALKKAKNGSDPRTHLLSGYETPVEEWEGPGTYILTAAQGGVKPHAKFLQNLIAYANYLDAALLVAPVVYDTREEKNTKEKAKADGDPYTWDPSLDHYLVRERQRLCPTFEFTASLNILPTAVNPLAGVVFPPRVSSAVPHQKRALNVYPVSTGTKPVYRYTTGVCTQPRHIQRKAGQAAEFHHVLGALIVEVDEDGDWFARQITAAKSGAFYDLGYHVDKEKIYHDADSVRVLTLGDWHNEGGDRRAEEATVFGSGSMCEALCPETLVLHDFFDGLSVNPHARWGERYAHSVGEDALTVKEEVQAAAATLDTIGLLVENVVIVASNHDRFLKRWLDTHDYRSSPQDALFFLELEAERLRNIEAKGGRSVLRMAMELCGFIPRKTTRFLNTGESCNIGGIEYSHHGDIGPNGTRGSAAGLAKTAEKLVIGHTHTPHIKEGVYGVGHTCKRDQGYNAAGPSSWDYAACVSYKDGHRAIISMVEKGDRMAWRAE